MEKDEKITSPKSIPLLIVISGPSGVGKDCVVNRMADKELPFHFVVTATTRPPRADEIDGVDYYFYNKAKFTRMIAQDELLEYAIVYDEYKGIPKFEVQKALDSGKDVVMRLDVQGAASIRELYPQALLIFLVADSEAELLRRLETRETESPEKLQIRIETAQAELKQVGEFDYVVTNRNQKLDEAVETIKSIILAEHCRVHHRKVNL
jgi:guanylate kinase